MNIWDLSVRPSSIDSTVHVYGTLLIIRHSIWHWHIVLLHIRANWKVHIRILFCINSSGFHIHSKVWERKKALFVLSFMCVVVAIKYMLWHLSQCCRLGSRQLSLARMSFWRRTCHRRLWQWRMPARSCRRQPTGWVQTNPASLTTPSYCRELEVGPSRWRGWGFTQHLRVYSVCESLISFGWVFSKGIFVC